jgi:uncharacterized protein
MPSAAPATPHLLDANALIALCWPHHEHHRRMLAWFSKSAAQGWATCALTQAAFVRIGLQPAFSSLLTQGIAVGDLAQLLANNTAHAAHRLLPLDFGFDTVSQFCTGGIWGHRQITDAWLLSAAIRHGHKLLSFDTGISALLATAQEKEAHLSLL